MHQNTTASFNSHYYSNKELEKIYRQHYPNLLYFASNIIDSAEAEEIVNDTFMKLRQKNPADFADEKLLKAFLYIVTRNACFRSLQRIKSHTLDEKQFITLYYTEEVMEQSEILRKIKLEVEALPTLERRVMELVGKGKKQAEIAELMDLDVEKVKTIRRKALNRLRLKVLDQGIPLLYIYLLFKEN